MFGNDSLPSRVYEYGLLVPVEGAAQVDEQMSLAHRYRNKLVEIELERRRQTDAALREVCPSLQTIENRISELDQLVEQHRAAIKKRNAQERKRACSKEESETVKTSVRERSSLYKERSSIRKRLFGPSDAIKEVRDEIKALKKTKSNLGPQRFAARMAELDQSLQAATDDWLQAEPLAKELRGRLTLIDQTDGEARRKARAESGLYWGTYLIVEDAMSDCRSGAPPRFQRWTGDGSVAVQIQATKPISDSDLFGSDSRVRVDPVDPAAWTSPVRGERRRNSRTRLWLRIGSEGREPVWAVFPMILHRSLPTGCSVKWVRVHRRRVASHYQWRVQFVVSRENGFDAKPNCAADGVVAINLGFRDLEEGLRVAYWAGDDGQHDWLELTSDITNGLDKVEDLQSIRTTSFNEMVQAVGAFRAERTDQPEWWRAHTAHLAQWRSPGRLAALTIRWRTERFNGDDQILSAIEAWLKQDKHLWEWERNSHQQLLRRRRELYRTFAARLRQQYRTVLIDDIDLRDFAATPEAEDDDTLSKRARKNRHRACLSEFVAAIANSGMEVRRHDPKNLTRRCHQCGALEDFDAKAELCHSCSSCASSWDQDYNHCLNLLAVASDAVAAE